MSTPKVHAYHGWLRVRGVKAAKCGQRNFYDLCDLERFVTCKRCRALAARDAEVFVPGMKVLG